LQRVKDLIGIPFVEGGRDPKSGLDCLGLAGIAARRFNPDADISLAYIDHDATADVLELYAKERPRWERIGAPEPGCAVTMRIDPERPDLVQHLGIYIGEKYVLQTLRKMKTHLVRIDDPYFGKKIEGFYRWNPAQKKNP